MGAWHDRLSSIAVIAFAAIAAVPIAETVLPRNLCPLIKSTYGFAYSEKPSPETQLFIDLANEMFE